MLSTTATNPRPHGLHSILDQTDVVELTKIQLLCPHPNLPGTYILPLPLATGAERSDYSRLKSLIPPPSSLAPVDFIPIPFHYESVDTLQIMGFTRPAADRLLREWNASHGRDFLAFLKNSVRGWYMHDPIGKPLAKWYEWCQILGLVEPARDQVVMWEFGGRMGPSGTKAREWVCKLIQEKWDTLKSAETASKARVERYMQGLLDDMSEEIDEY